MNDIPRIYPKGTRLTVPRENFLSGIPFYGKPVLVSLPVSQKISKEYTAIVTRYTDKDVVLTLMHEGPPDENDFCFVCPSAHNDNNAIPPS